MRIKYDIKISYYNNKIFHYVKNDFEHIKWYDNGKIYVHCYYKDNILDREYTEYDKKGNIIEHLFYKNGKIVKEEI